MDLNKALEGLFDAEQCLRSTEGISNPVYMSTHMMRLSQYTGAVEEKLAEYEKDLEIQSGKLLKDYMINKKMKATPAEAMVGMEMAEVKGQVKYLTRVTASAWRQVGVIQSRINHLVREAGTQI